MERLKNNKGNAIVEATIVFPIIIMIIIVLFYAALFLCQKANLQANLQTSLIYFKNLETDANVVIDPSGSSSILDLKANKYSKPKIQNPYRNFFMISSNKPGEFKSLFYKISGQMFFTSTSDIDIDYKVHNYILYQDITATAVQEVKLPIDFKLLGISPKITIATEAKVVITDPDEFARTSQLIGDLVADTKLGEIVEAGESKIASGYNKIKNVLHID